MSGGTKYDFRKIQFGYTDAQTEGQECPNLMTDGYVDIEDVVSKALFSTIFLFLGYKGSGKSALSEHLRLSAGENYITCFQLRGHTECDVQLQRHWSHVLFPGIQLHPRHL